MTRFFRADFFGVGIDHGDSPPPSSAKREELLAGRAGSSPKRDLEVFNGAASVGEEPNNDMMDETTQAKAQTKSITATDAGNRDRDLRVELR